MTEEFKQKYLKTIKMLDEVELDAQKDLDNLYSIFMKTLVILKSQHSLVTKDVKGLPKKISSGRLPIAELEGVCHVIDSCLSQKDRLTASDVIETMLQQIEKDRRFGEKSSELLQQFERSASDKDLLKLSKDLVKTLALVDSNVLDRGNNEITNELDQYKNLLKTQLEQLGEEVLSSLGMRQYEERIREITSVKQLELYYQEIFANLGKKLAKKDDFIVELSGLIETVVFQVSELANEIKLDGAEEKKASQDRWRLTELMDGQISTLRESILQDDSLESLKSKLTDELNGLNETVVNLITLEEARAKNAEAHVQTVSNKLSAVEHEMKELRTSLQSAYDQAMTDPLTGLPNRRAYDDRLKLEIDRCRRYQQGLVLAVLDLDHFKKINDNYGHPAGDKVLKAVSARINEQVRDTDFFGRIGGEEFVLLFTGSDLINALKRLDGFREKVAECKFGFSGKRVPVTLSAGCAQFEKGDGKQSLYERADKALYEAKNNGRNCCKSA